MFCKYCGKPIDETTMRCRICGRPVGTLEGGNGFWDLTGEKPAQPSAGDDTALRELREQVESLREELQQLQARPAAKKHSAGVLAALLALLALAVGVFALFQLRGLAGSLEELKTGSSGKTAIPPIPTYASFAGENGAPSEQENPTGIGEQAAEMQPDEPVQLGLRTPWEMENVEKIELDDGVSYVLWPGYFDGPRGEGDTKRQSITPRDPIARQTDVYNIFNATFLGQHTGDPEKGVAADPGNFDCYWAKVELDEDGKLASVTRIELAADPEHPDLEKDRFIDRIGPGNSHGLFIIGGAEDGEEGCYALIAERTNSLTGRYAYVSEIIELYIKDR